jgi:GTP-binding protein Era
MTLPEPGAVVRSGFVALVGRPNVGKSSLLNRIVGAKVSITAPSPNTTRGAVRGVLEGPGFQAVVVDTPGLHRPRSLLGERLNDSARRGADEADVVVLVVDASSGIGAGDRHVAALLGPGSVVALNKIDRTPRARLLERLSTASEDLGLGEAELFPVSARTGEGVAALVEHLVGRLEAGPRYFPPGTTSDVREDERVAELVREQLLKAVRDELPHSIACRVVERDGGYVRCEILVERESQKAIVIGRKGAVLKAAGTAARAALPPGTYLDLVVKVEKDWQRRAELLSRLGY